MAFRVLADAVVVLHLAFIVFIALGALLAVRWPRLVWLHVPCVTWGVAIITIGFDCPLTPLEKWLRRMAGQEGYAGGFVDRYVEGVVYPEEFTPLLRGLGAIAIAAGYALVFARWRRSTRREAVRTAN